MKRVLPVGLMLLAAIAVVQAGTSEEQQIEETIAAVVKAYSAGDYDTLRTYYAPDVTVVPGDYSPTLSGWSTVEPRYRQAHLAYGHIELVRENTKIIRRGKIAWASYQWQLAGLRGKELLEVRGQTTLVLEKRKGHWLIVHNHTSLVPPRAEAPQPAAGQPKP